MFIPFGKQPAPRASHCRGGAATAAASSPPAAAPARQPLLSGEDSPRVDSPEAGGLWQRYRVLLYPAAFDATASYLFFAALGNVSAPVWLLLRSSLKAVFTPLLMYVARRWDLPVDAVTGRDLFSCALAVLAAVAIALPTMTAAKLSAGADSGNRATVGLSVLALVAGSVLSAAQSVADHVADKLSTFRNDFEHSGAEGLLGIPMAILAGAVTEAIPGIPDTYRPSVAARMIAADPTLLAFLVVQGAFICCFFTLLINLGKIDPLLRALIRVADTCLVWVAAVAVYYSHPHEHSMWSTIAQPFDGRSAGQCAGLVLIVASFVVQTARPARKEPPAADAEVGINRSDSGR